MEKLENKIEAVLFYKNEPMAIKEIGKILGKSEEEIKEGIDALKENLKERGLTLIEDGEKISLATSGDTSELIDKIAKEEMSKDIGKAGLETLAIILYKGSASRREIDYIRGVNSTFILRSLLVKGLVEKAESEKDARTYLYKPTLELLAHLGLESAHKLPEYGRIQAEIEAIEKSEENAN